VVAVLVLGALGQDVPLSRPLVDTAMLTSGVIMGGGATPEALAAVARYPGSLLILVLCLAAISGGSALWLMRRSGWRRDDALLASVPGALSTVLIIAADRNADVPAITAVQSFRFVVLVILLPMAVMVLGGGAAPFAARADQPIASPQALAAMLLCGWGLGLVFQRLRISAPILLGAATASALLHATGAAPGAVPPSVAIAGFVLIGVFLAARFHGFPWIGLRQILPAAFGSLAVGMSIAGLFASAAAIVAGVGFADALIAFAPGGLEAMLVLALALGLDPLYVGTHHLARFLLLGFGLPLAMAWLTRWDARRTRG